MSKCGCIECNPYGDEPDQIDMMTEAELRQELRSALHKLDAYETLIANSDPEGLLEEGWAQELYRELHRKFYPKNYACS